MYLTKRQRQMLDHIEAFIRKNGYSPSLEEIGEMMGLSSPATVHKHLMNLEAKGRIVRRHNHSRALEIVREADGPAAVPMLGYVAAGAPIEAIENPETMEIPRDFLGARDTYVLRVKGESMIEDGIRDGDWIVVEKRERADPGQTVVALVRDREATVKRYYPERGGVIRLQPANADMAPMRYPMTDVAIQGIVIGLLRRYR